MSTLDQYLGSVYWISTFQCSSRWTYEHMNIFYSCLLTFLIVQPTIVTVKITSSYFLQDCSSPKIILRWQMKLMLCYYLPINRNTKSCRVLCSPFKSCRLYITNKIYGIRYAHFTTRASPIIIGGRKMFTINYADSTSHVHGCMTWNDFKLIFAEFARPSVLIVVFLTRPLFSVIKLSKRT